MWRHVKFTQTEDYLNGAHVSSSRFSFTFLLVALTLSGSHLSAQEDNPLDFKDKSQRIGLEVGFTSAYQIGSYSAGCEIFDQGASLNFLIAAAYDQEFGDQFRLEGLLGYQSRSVRSSFNSRESVGLATESGPVNALVDFENIGRADFGYLFFQPGIKFYPFSGLYVGAGASVNLLLGSSTQYQKDILSRTVELNELGLSEVFYSETESSDPYSMVYAEETRDDAASTTLDGVIMVGAEFAVGPTVSTPIDAAKRKRIAIGPRLQYVIPFMNALSDGERAMKLGSFQFLVGFRYEL